MKDGAYFINTARGPVNYDDSIMHHRSSCAARG
jgi:phosphoglycerate dehydrogenase-like enzyme